jgi:hypothetical protein
MKRIILVLVCFGLLDAGILLQGADKAPIVVIARPTVVAFFPRVSDAELAKDPDTNEALSDFQLYASQVRSKLQMRGIDFREIYDQGFSIRMGSQITRFTPGKVTVGYYLIAPGKKPLVKYGVMTDEDLLQLAEQYFGSTRK